jgi:hypothetical protein
MDAYDAYDADDEYDVNDEVDRFPQIERQVFINLGAYMKQLFDEPRDNMCRVLGELVALHRCKDEQIVQIVGHVGACRQPIRSIDSELFSLCSELTDDTVFKYYISDDDINVELT